MLCFTFVAAVTDIWPAWSLRDVDSMNPWFFLKCVKCFICSVLSSSSNQRHVVLQHWEQQGYKTSSLTTLTHIFSVTDDALCNPSSGIWKHFHYTSFGGGITTRNQIQMDLTILLLQMTNVFTFQTASSYRANCLATAFTDLTQIQRTESCPSRGGLGILSVSSSWTQKRIRCHPICTYTSKRDKGVPCACVPCHEECGEVEAEIYILQISGLNTRARLTFWQLCSRGLGGHQNRPGHGTIKILAPGDIQLGRITSHLVKLLKCATV